MEAAQPKPFEPPECGTVSRLSDAEYRDAPGLSRTSLLEFWDCPGAWNAGVGKPQTEVMWKGIMLHALLELAEAQFLERFRIKLVKTDRKKSKLWNQVEKRFPTHQLMKEMDFQALRDMREALLGHEKLSSLILSVKPEHQELACWGTDPETGIYLKCKLDFLVVDEEQHLILDVKTSEASTKALDFANHSRRLQYGIQDVFYSHVYELATGIKPLGFIFGVVPQVNPHPKRIGFYHFGERTRKAAEEQFRAMLQLYVECHNEDKWPGYADYLTTVDYVRD